VWPEPKGGETRVANALPPAPRLYPPWGEAPVAGNGKQTQRRSLSADESPVFRWCRPWNVRGVGVRSPSGRWIGDVLVESGLVLPGSARSRFPPPARCGTAGSSGPHRPFWGQHPRYPCPRSAASQGKRCRRAPCPSDPGSPAMARGCCLPRPALSCGSPSFPRERQRGFMFILVPGWSWRFFLLQNLIFFFLISRAEL